MKQQVFSWVVVGAGPAGIAAIGKLLDRNIPKEEICWIDPVFKVGDLGEKWLYVSSNTKVDLFLRFLNDCSAFRYKECKQRFPIDELAPSDHCLLKEIAAPLQWVTDHLRETVSSVEGEAVGLVRQNGSWEIETRSSSIRAKNVVLCIGSEPKQLSYPRPQAIPLETALDPSKLAKEVDSEDVVGVFGASHSSVLIMASLLELHPKMVHNFYRSPHTYAIEFEDWILFDNIGLKGFAAKWAKEHLDGTLPKNLNRCLVSDKLFDELLAECTKVIYSVGFRRRKTPVIEQYPKAEYQETTGIIAPGLFGLGIAYPQAQFDRLGNLEYRVGLWKFMDYLNSVLPFWLEYGN